METSRNPATRKFLRDHLGDNESIIRSSIWADSDDALSSYPGSDDLHFSNTPWRRCSTFNMTRDCGFDGSGRCIVSGIADFFQIAIDPSQPKSKRVDALKFLIHLVADIHQPLHTGFVEDSGGVNIQIASDPPILSLHQMWDYGIWESVIGDDIDESATSPHIGYEPQNISLVGPIMSENSVLQFAADLATESSNLLTCNFAYKNEVGQFIKSKQILTHEYIRSRRTVIASRIELAGSRLANVLIAISATFYKNSIRPGRSVTPTTPIPTRPANMFAVLPIEFEPDDFIEEFRESRAVSAAGSPSARRVPQPSRGVVSGASKMSGGKISKVSPLIYNDVDLAPAEPMKIGEALLTNVTLVKRRERFIVTCKHLVEGVEDYDPVYVHHFRVRFSRNRKRTDPIVFLVDFECFGRSLTQQEFLIVLYHFSGNDLSTIPAAAAGSSITVYSRPHKDAIEFEPIDGEVEYRDEATKKIYRGWNPFYLGDNRIIRAYLQHMEDLHLADQIDQLQFAKRNNKTLEAKWDFDFYSKIRDILVYRVGKLQVIINRHTLTDSDRVEMQFAVYNCICKSPVDFEDRPKNLGEDPAFTTLIDINIFDGYITERILKGLSAIVRKSIVPDPIFRTRPTFFSELSDVDSILHGKGADRASRFQAIQGFYMFPSVVSCTVAYIQWSIIPTMFQPIDETTHKL